MIHLIKQSQEKKSVSFLTWRFRGRCSVESVNVNGSIALLYTSCPPVSKGGGCTEWTAEAKEVWPTIPIWTIGSHAFCDKMFGSVEYCTYSHRRLSSDTVPVGKTQPFYCMFLCHCEKRSIIQMYLNCAWELTDFKVKWNNTFWFTFGLHSAKQEVQ